MLPRSGFFVSLIAAVSVALALVSKAEANHDYYQYKFPCKPNDICYVTTLAHTGNAFDFDPLGSAGLGDIAAVSEGTFQGYVAAQTTCTSSGLGQYAVISDVFGRTMAYAHLSQFGDLVVGQKVYQGDIVGVEGNTGNTSGDPQNPFAPHLHLQGISTVPGIDGHSLASVGLTSYYSSNSRVGNHTAIPGNVTTGSQAIRAIYKFTAYAGLPWATFGWTADWTGSQGGCFWPTHTASTTSTTRRIRSWGTGGCGRRSGCTPARQR